MITGVSYAGKPLDNTAMYITKKVEHLVKNLDGVVGCKVFVEDTVCVPDELRRGNEFVFTQTPQRDYALFVQQMDKERASINRSRKYTKTEGGYTIGENVSIGKGSFIEPNAFIDHDVIIGSNAYIKSGAIIRNAIIGDNIIISENCTIGSDGFTMAEDELGNKIRIPTLGRVIIKNNVEISALSNISCGSAGNTIIGDNVKIDSLVHIGHDVYLGRNVEITAGVIVAGFVVIEDGAYVGINATIRNRRDIGRNAFIGMGAVVTKNVESDVTVVGNPAKLFSKE